MISKKIGMITIGQSPRVDIIPEMREVLGADVQILEAGALDGLTLEKGEEIWGQGNPQIRGQVLNFDVLDLISFIKRLTVE